MRGNYAFHGWIRDSLHKNVRYDEFALRARRLR